MVQDGEEEVEGSKGKERGARGGAVRSVSEAEDVEDQLRGQHGKGTPSLLVAQLRTEELVPHTVLLFSSEQDQGHHLLLKVATSAVLLRRHFSSFSLHHFFFIFQEC